MECLYFSLDWPPSVNRLYGRSNRAQWNKSRTRRYYPVYLSKDGRDYKSYVAWQFGSHEVRVDGEVAILYEFYPPDHRRRRDMSNFLKVVDDALVGANIIEDDSYIRSAHMEWMGVLPGGKIDLTLFKLKKDDNIHDNILHGVKKLYSMNISED